MITFHLHVPGDGDTHCNQIQRTQGGEGRLENAYALLSIAKHFQHEYVVPLGESRLAVQRVGFIAEPGCNIPVRR